METSGGSRMSRSGGVDPLGGGGGALTSDVGENVCENEKNGFHRESCTGHAP